MSDKKNREIMQDINDVRGYYAIGLAVLIPSIFGSILAYKFGNNTWTSILLIIASMATGMIAFAKTREIKVMQKELPKQFNSKRSTKIKINTIIGTSAMPIIFLFMIFVTGSALPFLEHLTYTTLDTEPSTLQKMIFGIFSEFISVTTSYFIGMRFCRIAIFDASEEHYEIFGEKDYFPLKFLSTPVEAK
ncbi:MAG: hypothetical protein GY804_10695 [Alphaproteobacteria bacterium]|nr:hypothetical protein [Alphaproteobacteria bacterium]